MEDLVSPNVGEQLHLASDVADETDLVVFELSPSDEIEGIEVPPSTNNESDMVALESSPSDEMPDMVNLESSPVDVVDNLGPSNENKAEKGTATRKEDCG